MSINSCDKLLHSHIFFVVATIMDTESFIILNSLQLTAGSSTVMLHVYVIYDRLYFPVFFIVHIDG